MKSTTFVDYEIKPESISFIFAPFCSKNSTIFKWPFFAANNNGKSENTFYPNWCSLH